jgi:L-ascorbate oxidase
MKTRTILRYCLAVSTLFPFVAPAAQESLQNPPVFASNAGELNILLVVKPKHTHLAGGNPTAWIYEVCLRRDAVGDSCPKGSKTASVYGGPHLELQPGDHLRVRLVNELPPTPADAKHAQGDMGEMLQGNPTNIHTHGLIVEPRQATLADPTYGDYVYVLGYPAGRLPNMQHPGLDYTDKPIDYDIYLPRNHPAGLFWMHPHVHGLALNQVSSGMAGIITVGSVGDYLSDGGAHAGFAGAYRERFLTLKDMQVLPDGSVQDQEDPGFCDSAPSPDEQPREGFCPGILIDDGQGNVVDYRGGKWVFSINGQVFPTIAVQHGTGEIWRFTNASGSRAYDLALVDDQNGNPLQFQVLAVDGVSIDSAASATLLSNRLKGKIKTESCAAASPSGHGTAVCASGLRMFPSSRVEIWVSSRQAEATRSATLTTREVQTGPAGDDWPSSGLAHVVFNPGAGQVIDLLNVFGQAGNLLKSDGLLADLPRIAGGNHPDELTVQQARDLAYSKSLNAKQTESLREHLTALSAPSQIPSPECRALPAKHSRRIFFGLPTSNPDAFGLAYEELDEKGNPVPGSFSDIEAFDHLHVTVCLPLGPGNKSVSERWQLVNVAGEDHNFHIHQTKFRVLASGAGDTETGALVDNVPVPHGSDGCDGSVATWRTGACRVKPVSVEIPFSQVGDFVYHCHILEHEDGGMMAHIRVVPSN